MADVVDFQKYRQRIPKKETLESDGVQYCLSGLFGDPWNLDQDPAPIYSIGAFRVFRDPNRARMDSAEWAQNQAEAIVFSWTTIFMHQGLPKEIAVQKAIERLQILKSQEGIHGTDLNA